MARLCAAFIDFSLFCAGVFVLVWAVAQWLC